MKGKGKTVISVVFKTFIGTAFAGAFALVAVAGYLVISDYFYEDTTDYDVGTDKNISTDNNGSYERGGGENILEDDLFMIGE
ncbi:hypothetical protein CFK37_17945 [Virgibacillus phasianinus]|uniref:Uncharacterized protein n=1 Tax=Virgibacillus phasianinus TaxID=2017483 RepID=A0A220U830_9BACI|nr:hypothetical protein [Virgibacillus phasianinus]ASK63903.1 hypothetical protein CFK37_17945 [Virgibacillus phasianinus]